MNVPLTILAVVCMTLGLFGSLTLMVFALACRPNSSPGQLRTIKRVILAIVMVGLLCVVGGVTLVVWHHPLWASAIAIIPAAIVVCGMVCFGVHSAWKTT